MSGTEGVINIDIRQRGQRLREGRFVPFFFLVKAKILKQNNTVTWILEDALNFRADTIGR